MLYTKVAEPAEIYSRHKLSNREIKNSMGLAFENIFVFAKMKKFSLSQFISC